MKRYSNYEFISARWYNQIPIHWHLIRIKDLISQSNAGAWGDDPETDNGTICLRVADMDFNLGVFKNKPVSVLTKRLYTEEQIEKLTLEQGDILIEKSGGGEKSPVGRSVYFDKSYPALFANFMQRSRFKHKLIDAHFASYLLRTMYYRGATWYYVKQTTGIQNLDLNSMLAQERFPVPPREEQDQIVRYLDRQVSKINRLIAAKRKEIALLKEQKQRKITEVVVHGLKPNVPHKDTGIAWIGSIPAHWHCVALKRCATVKSGITLGKQYPVGTNLVSVPYLRVANVQDGFVNIETVTNLNVTPEEAAQYRLPRGCVLMTEGGDRDKLGRGCVWNGEIENCIHQNHIFAVTVNDKLLLNKWLEYVSACDIGRVYFDVTAIKTTNLACTNASKVMAFPIPLPPRDEQECIINELNRITSRFNDAREGLEKQIEYLQELRIRLISDVVTGQIDVRGIEVPKHESVDDVVAESEVEELEVE